MKTTIQKTDVESAIRAIQSTGIATPRGFVPSEFNGYISSFGAAIVQSGLLPAVIFFEDAGRASQDRTLLMEAISQMMAISTPKLSTYLLQPGTNQTNARQEVLRAAVALKLALRTFKLVKPK